MKPPPDETDPAAYAVALARTIHSEHFSTGDRAALKRMGLKGAAPLAFERLLLERVSPRCDSFPYRSAWRTVIAALALQRSASTFNAAVRFGRALQEAGYSELRLERLLGAEGAVLQTLALRAARLLAAKRIACDWREFAELLFARAGPARERINTKIARAYFRTEPLMIPATAED